MTHGFEKIQFMKALSALGNVCGVSLDDFLIDRYVERLEKYGYREVTARICRLIDNPPANRRIPSPGEIAAFFGEVNVSDEDLARDAAARIKGAVSRFGYPNWEEARRHIGALGERIVLMMGGWNNVCDYKTEHDLDVALAQAREWAKVHVKKDRAGIAELPPSLPSLTEGRGYDNDRSGKLTLLANVDAKLPPSTTTPEAKK